MYNRKAFKREAKELMRESTPHYMLVMLIYVLLTTGLSYVVSALSGIESIGSGILGMFLNLLIALFSMVLSVGLANYTLNLARRKPTAMGDLFEGFSFAGRSIGMNILVAVYSFLWGMLAVVGFAVVIGIAAVVMEAVTAVGVILMVAAYIALIVAVFAITLRYAMAQFALVEHPDDGASAAIRRSVQIMKGNKGKYFVLMLSFIGWGLLIALISMLVMGVGVAVTGVDWFVGLFQSVSEDPMDVYAITMEAVGTMSLWVIIAEVICLPLTLWLTAYQQTTFARFYNYVSGYDYHQYMNEGQENVPAESTLPEAAPAEPSDPPTPPGGFYTPVEPAEELPEEAEEEETEEEAEEE